MGKFSKRAEALGGEKTWRFNQAKFSQWRKRIGTGTLGGICWACSVAYIIGEHINQPLKEKVGDDGDLHGGAYRTLIRAQNIPNSLKEQEEAEVGLCSKQGLTIDEWNISSVERGNSSTPLGGTIADRICRRENCYVLVSLRWNKLFGHRVAASLAPGDYRFFDPNAGEYTFPDKTKFKQFVSDYTSQKYKSIKSFKLRSAN